MDRVAAASLPEGAVVAGVVANAHSAVQTLSDILAKMEVTTAHAALNIPPNLVQIKQIPKEEKYLSVVGDQVEWEISHHINEPLDEYELSAHSLLVSTVLVAARRRALETRTKVLEEAGLVVVAVDPDPIAVFNAIAAASGAKPNKNIVVVDVEVPYSSVVLFAKGDFGYGGAFFTPPELFGLGEGRRTWREFQEDLAAFVRMAVEAYRKLNPLFVAEGISFVGLGLKEGVASSVAAQVGLQVVEPVELVRKRVKVKPKKFGLSAQELFVAVGLAAHGAVVLS